MVPATSGYIASIHSGNTTNKTAALSNVMRTENHIIARIIPASDTNDHTPSLELTTNTPGATILYTFDFSSPVPGGATTHPKSQFHFRMQRSTTENIPISTDKQYSEK